MKLKLNKNLRIGSISILSILAILNVYLIYQGLKIPKFETQIIPGYSYNNKATTNSTIFLKPNNIYAGNSIEEGKVYISELVDYINTTFIYELTGDSEASIEGNYSIYGKVEGITGREDEKLTIWEKNFPIIRSKKFKSNDGKLSINEEVRLDLNEYNTFITGIEESTKIKSDTTLTLMMDINLTGTTDKGIFEENIIPNIVIPLNTPMFEITTNNVEKPGAIEETIQVQQPVNRTLVIVHIVLLCILLAALIFIIFFTKAAPKKDPLEKELKKLFKKHGDRLVALSNPIDTTDALEVRSIDDLVKLADEVNKPIFYKYSDNYNEIDTFYVKSDKDIYFFSLKIEIPTINIEDSPSSENIVEKLKIES